MGQRERLVLAVQNHTFCALKQLPKKIPTAARLTQMCRH